MSEVGKSEVFQMRLRTRLNLISKEGAMCLCAGPALTFCFALDAKLGNMLLLLAV